MVIQRQDFLLLAENTDWTTPSAIKHQIGYSQLKPIYYVNHNKSEVKQLLQDLVLFLEMLSISQCYSEMLWMLQKWQEGEE